MPAFLRRQAVPATGFPGNGNGLANTDTYQTSLNQGVHSGRQAAGAIAGGVGDPRRAAVCPGGG